MPAALFQLTLCPIGASSSEAVAQAWSIVSSRGPIFPSMTEFTTIPPSWVPLDMLAPTGPALCASVTRSQVPPWMPRFQV
jgi:hypothetical protein